MFWLFHLGYALLVQAIFARLQHQDKEEDTYVEKPIIVVIRDDDDVEAFRERLRNRYGY